MKTREEIMGEVEELQRVRLAAEAAAEHATDKIKRLIMEAHGVEPDENDGEFYVGYLGHKYLVTIIEASAVGKKPFLSGRRFRKDVLPPASHFLGDAWEPLP